MIRPASKAEVRWFRTDNEKPEIFTPQRLLTHPAGAVIFIAGGFISRHKSGYNLHMKNITKASSRSIQPVVTFKSSRDLGNDFTYWQAQPYELRLAALEEIRAEYNQWRYGAQPRLQRVYSIVKR